MKRPIEMLLGLILAIGACATTPVEQRPAPSAGDPRVAVERALPFIERGGDDWMEGRVAMQGGKRCVSCHHVAYAIWAHHEARRGGLAIPEARIEELTRRAVSFLDEAGVRAMSAGPLLLGLEGERVDGVERLAREIADQQERSGHWRARGQFPDQRRSESESDAVATMWTLLALPEDARHARARGWLERAGDGASTEWLALRALHGDGEPAALVAVQMCRYFSAFCKASCRGIP